MSHTIDKVAIVTGAGSGIGRATSAALLRHGYAVVLAGRRRAGLEQSAALANAGNSLPGAAERTLVVPTDVSDLAAVQALFDKTKQMFGRLDLLFNNAGIGAPAVPLE